MNISVFGIPSYSGALYEGTEFAPGAVREAGLVQRFIEKGYTVEDYGNLLDGTGLPRHNVSPIRNWPAPRMVWEIVVENANMLFGAEWFSVIIGGDCSLEVGTFTAFRKVFGEASYLLVLDGHVDTMEPRGDRCIGAAGMGLWFLTQDQTVWWREEPVPVERISVVGVHTQSENHFGIEVVPLVKINKLEEVLNRIPEDAKILVHFDVDVLHKSVMPAAYAPSEKGLNFEQASALLGTILRDQRVKGIEVTEFSANKDVDGNCARVIVDLLSLIGEK